METRDFLEELYGGVEGYIYLWTLPGKRTYAFATSQLSDMAAKARELSGAKENVYFGIGATQRRLGENERAKSDEVAVLPGVWVDIDIAHQQAHKAGNLPSDVAAAMSLLPDELPPTIVVHSGYGLHAYWLFKEPWALRDAGDKADASKTIRRVENAVRSAAKKHGWHLDPTSDLARVLRLPNTWNLKLEGTPALCQVIESTDDLRYNPHDFDVLPEAPAVAQMSTRKQGSFERRPGDGTAELMLQNCRFLQYWSLNYKTLPEPVWQAAMTNLVRGVGGEQLIEDTARDWLGEKFNEKQTRERIHHALHGRQPLTCQTIREETGFDGCPPDGCDVQSPCAWALAKVARAKATVRAVATITSDTVLRPDVIGALAVLEKEDRAEYARFCENCRGHVNLNELKAVIREHNKKQTRTQLQVIDGGSAEGETLQEGESRGSRTTCGALPETPIDLAIPVNFSYGADGVQYLQHRENGTVSHRATGVPAVITGRIYNIDTGLETVELSFRYFDKWRRVVQPRSTVFNARQIVKLTDYGLNTSSESSKYLVKYLEALESSNLDKIPLRYAVSRLGWRDETGEFILPSDSGYRLDVSDGDGRSVVSGFSVAGQREDWVSLMRQARSMSTMSRFLLAAGFAPPLLKLFGQRNYILHVHGESRGGKTAALWMATSIWGHPNKLAGSFSSTDTGIEGRAALYNDLPLVINEREVLSKQQKDSLQPLLYRLSEGKERARGRKDGTLQAQRTWRTMVLTSGEGPLSTEHSLGGMITRTLEFDSVPFGGQEAFAKSLYFHLPHCHGHAGREYAAQLQLTNRENLYDRYQQTREGLAQAFPQNVDSHVDAVACVAMADYLSSLWIFGEDETTAAQGAGQCAAEALQLLPAAADADESMRAWVAFRDYLAQNSHLIVDIMSPSKNSQFTASIGYREPTRMSIIRASVERFIEDHEFSSVRKILRQWAQRGWIESSMECGKLRYDFRGKMVGGVRPRVVVVPVDN
ncbi:MAG: DUF927 domain-containing protein [Anaeromusa sp.]|uniref:DUF927 domain-containing protein n=1 Tax=Anaeromusa sp. TaxID=1872520 RepID=UPI002B1F53AE|nr:DUF927 domain-containing protein [Anaeromusa sp.]MEA4834981.1 DUF927 domain-containing protein [Anaeromusa sp.]